MKASGNARPFKYMRSKYRGKVNVMNGPWEGFKLGFAMFLCKISLADWKYEMPWYLNCSLAWPQVQKLLANGSWA